MTISLLDWEWEAVNLIHHSQVGRHGQAWSNRSQPYLHDNITLSDFFLRKAPSWESCHGSKEAEEANAVRGRHKMTVRGRTTAPGSWAVSIPDTFRTFSSTIRGNGSFQNDAMTWLSCARAKGDQQNGNRTIDPAEGKDFRHPCPVPEQ